MDNKFMPYAVKTAEIVQEKNAIYGDAAGKSAEYLKLLYPNGVSPAQYLNMLLLVRDFDKNMRIATDEDALGESPWEDKAGYAILAVELKNRGREQKANRNYWWYVHDICYYCENKVGCEEPCEKWNKEQQPIRPEVTD